MSSYIIIYMVFLTHYRIIMPSFIISKLITRTCTNYTRGGMEFIERTVLVVVPIIGLLLIR